MRRSGKLAVTAAAGLVPFLLGQAAAGAAVASDSDSDDVIYTPSNGGDRTPCLLAASHDVDTGAGSLDVQFSAGCGGTITITVRYTDENGEALTTSTTAHGTTQAIHLHKVGSTAVTADYSFVIDGCAESCTGSLHTATK